MKDELIQYFFVNKDVGMGKGKVGAQVAHAATIYTYVIMGGQSRWKSKISFSEIDNFHLWFRTIQKKIILKASQELMERLENEGFLSIRDKGYTQVAPNSLTVVTIGVMTREEAKKLIPEIEELSLL